MLTDAHCHPYYCKEKKYENTQVLKAASACEPDEFLYIEKLESCYPCFGIHPQDLSGSEESLDFLNKLANEKRIAAIGEIGFDLFNDGFKKTEKEQEKVFASQIEIALQYNLPVVLHVRKSLHKIFDNAKMLSKCKAVIIHSWSGSYEEGMSLLRKNVNAYFSCSNTILNGHKRAMQSCSMLPADRLLTETDAPYLPLQGQDYSSWENLPLILEKAAGLRREAGSSVNDVKELEAQVESNFKAAFVIF